MPVDKSEARVRRMFSDISSRYDFLNHLLSLNIDRYWRRATVRRVFPDLTAAEPDGTPAPILDVCTGTGDLALAYHRATGGRVPIVGADFSHEMLCIARAKGRRATGRVSESASGQVGLARQNSLAHSLTRSLAFVEADAQRLPLPDARFQIVCVAFGLRNVTDTRRGLAEMVRVCRPGGRVAILEFSMPCSRALRAAYGFYFRRVLPAIGQTLARNRHSAYNYLPASVLEFREGEALAELMRAEGLTDVAWHPLTFGVATLYVGDRGQGSAVRGQGCA